MQSDDKQAETGKEAPERASAGLSGAAEGQGAAITGRAGMFFMHAYCPVCGSAMISAKRPDHDWICEQCNAYRDMEMPEKPSNGQGTVEGGVEPWKWFGRDLARECAGSAQDVARRVIALPKGAPCPNHEIANLAVLLANLANGVLEVSRVPKPRAGDRRTMVDGSTQVFMPKPESPASENLGRLVNDICEETLGRFCPEKSEPCLGENLSKLARQMLSDEGMAEGEVMVRCTKATAGVFVSPLKAAPDTVPPIIAGKPTAEPAGAFEVLEAGAPDGLYEVSISHVTGQNPRASFRYLGDAGCEYTISAEGPTPAAAVAACLAKVKEAGDE